MKSFTNWTDTEILDICLFHTCGNMVCCVLCHICNLCVYLYYIFSTNRKWVVMCVNRFEATAQSGSDDAFRDLLDSTAVFASNLFKADFQNKKVLWSTQSTNTHPELLLVLLLHLLLLLLRQEVQPGLCCPLLLTDESISSEELQSNLWEAVWRRHQVTEVSQRWVAVSRHELVVSR